MSIDPINSFLDTEAAHALRGKRVLVTGASGFVGQHVARQGLAAGVEIHALGRSPGPVGVRDHRADLTDRVATRAAVSLIAPDLVLNLASPGVVFSTADYPEILNTLVGGTEALLSACCELPVRPHFVHIGTGFEYALQDRAICEADPLVPSSTRYGAAKAAASATVGGFAGMLPLTILRPFNIYGGGDVAPRLGSLIIASARAGQAINVTRGEQLRDFLHVDDCGRLIWQVAAEREPGNSFGVFNVGSGQSRVLRDYITSVGDALDRHGVPARINFGAARYRQGEPMIAVPDLTRLNASFDWQPRIGFAQGVEDYVCWSLSR